MIGIIISISPVLRPRSVGSAGPSPAKWKKLIPAKCFLSQVNWMMCWRFCHNCFYALHDPLCWRLCHNCFYALHALLCRRFCHYCCAGAAVHSDPIQSSYALPIALPLLCWKCHIRILSSAASLIQCCICLLFSLKFLVNVPGSVLLCSVFQAFFI